MQNVITEEQKYRSELFKICGLALMTPAGRIVVQPAVVSSEFGTTWFFPYIIAAVVLWFGGAYLLQKGYDILNE